MKKFLIIDGNALVHRAYHALPPLTTKTGERVNAVYGFLLVLFKAIKEFQPDFIAAAFDFPAPTFRHQQYQAYKATREKAPDELYDQIPKVKDLVQKFNVPVIEKEGYEGDDIIGTLARLAPLQQSSDLETVIISGDLDTLQLVDEKTKAYIPKRGVQDTILYDINAVRARYGGLTPAQLVDYKALRGDPSDNIPGVFGVGEKTAIFLLQEFGTLENLYQELDKNTEKAKHLKVPLRQKLLDHKAQAFISKDLAKIHRETPIEFTLSVCQWNKYDHAKVVEVLEAYGFKSLIPRLP